MMRFYTIVKSVLWKIGLRRGSGDVRRGGDRSVMIEVAGSMDSHERSRFESLRSQFVSEGRTWLERAKARAVWELIFLMKVERMLRSMERSSSRASKEDFDA